MKSSLIIIGVLAFLFMVLQAYTVFSTSKTEEQAYVVLKTDGKFEIRKYPVSIMASVVLDGKTYDENANKGFRQLAGYIFGGNQANQQIAMTSPVHMTLQDSNTVMSFVMPKNYKMSDLPKPTNESVMIHPSADQVRVSLTFGGYASDDKIQKHTEELEAYLTKNNLKRVGPVSYLGYNPPYQVIARKNEVSVAIEWND